MLEFRHDAGCGEYASMPRPPLLRQTSDFRPHSSIPLKNSEINSMKKSHASRTGSSLSSLILLFVTLLPLTAAHAQEGRKIRIGVEGAYPPFSQIGPDGKITGFDIDIANALCQQMKAQCTLVTQEFECAHGVG